MPQVPADGFNLAGDPEEHAVLFNLLSGCSTVQYLGSRTLEFERVTSSDWTYLAFEEPGRVSELTVLECDSEGDCGDGRDYVDLSQSFDRGKAGMQVRLTGSVTASKPLAEPLGFTIDRWDRGRRPGAMISFWCPKPE